MCKAELPNMIQSPTESNKPHPCAKHRDHEGEEHECLCGIVWTQRGKNSYNFSGHFGKRICP